MFYKLIFRPFFHPFSFRGFIQERAWQKEQGKPVGETHLYFGCRNKDKDFIYREELEKFVEDEVLTLHTAFSRDQEKKVYVTDRLREHMDNLWHLIGKKGAHVYVRAHHMFSRILKFTIFNGFFEKKLSFLYK